MGKWIKKVFVAALLLSSICAFYCLSSELLLLRDPSENVAWILTALQKVHFGKFDPAVLRSHHRIYPLSEEERKRVLEFLKVDLNQASLEEVIGLPHIGPSMAQKIIENRRVGGPFSSLEDLKRIKGLGAKRLKILKDWVKFGATDDGRRTTDKRDGLNED